METVTPQLLPAPKPTKLPRLKARHRKFVELLISTGNATQAVIKAGYRTAHPGPMGYRLSKLPAIKAHLEAIGNPTDPLIADALEVKRVLTRQMRASISPMITDSGELDIAGIKANGDLVASYSPGSEKVPAKVRLEGRQPAALALARIHGLLTDGANTVQVGIQLVVNGDPQGV